MNLGKLARISGNRKFVSNEIIPDKCPLSEAQRAIFLECLENPASDIYNVVFLCTLPVSVDLERFAECVKTAVCDYPVMNVGIAIADGVPSMIKRPEVLTPDRVNVEHVTTVDLKNEIEGMRHAFDLERDPLYEFKLCEYQDGKYFILNIHHIITDGTSIRLFVKHICDIYNGSVPSKEELTQFDVSLFETSLTPDDEKLEEARKFYEQYLGDNELDTIPVPDVTTEEKSDSSAIDFDADSYFTFEDLANLKQERHITENTIFQAAFAYTESVMAGTGNVFYMTAAHGRTDERMNGSLGMFVQSLPMYFDIDNDMDTDTFFNTVRQRFHNVKENDVLTFGELQSRYDINMKIVFGYMSDIFAPIPVGDGCVNLQYIDSHDTEYDIYCYMFKSQSGYKLRIAYRTDLYSESFVRNFARLYLNVVSGMLTAKKLGDIRLADSVNIEQLAKINQTESPYRDNETLVSLFRAQTSKTPAATCLVCGDKRYTYAEIDSLTDKLAYFLIQNGAAKEKVIGVLIGRSEYMFICALGILKSGSAYLPLDPTYPPERLNLMVQDSGAILLLTEPELEGLIDNSFTGKRFMTSAIAGLPEPAEDVVLPEPAPGDLFVMIYTSGSTGKPKGVMFEHSNALVTAEWVMKFYNMNGSSKVTSYASYGFDANVFDMYPPVISGGELHIIKEEMRLDFPALRAYYNDNGITHSVMTTQVGRQFALMGGLTTLKHLSVAGEKLTPLTPPEGMNLYNLYGPTEGSIITSYFPIDKYYNDVPIGRPVDNLKVYIVDKSGRLLPCGATGELLIAGPHVTRGYLNNPEKTAEVYKKNIYDDIARYERTYSTGDIVRLNEDGNMQFIGRRDQQVKIRGFRVELTEVEEVIRRFPGIKDATVAAFDDISGGKYLAAYIVSDSKIDTTLLEDFIRGEKPPYMVPAVTMQIDRIPLNQNHKVNRKALPLPERKKEEIVPPANEMQKKLHEILASIMGHTEFGITSDLYRSGLNSIGSVKLIVALDEEFKIPVKIADIKANPTITLLERFILGSSSSAADSASELKDAYPITDTQAGIYTECLGEPDSVTYNIPVLIRFDNSIDINKLREAVISAFDAHYYLKARFAINAEGGIEAKPCKEQITVDTYKCGSIPSAEQLVQPFKLIDSPLYRVSLYDTDDGKYLFMDIHHLICDGTSEAVLLNDISKAYAGESLKAETYSGFHKAEDEINARSSSAYDESKAYWKELLSSCETECLPKKMPDYDAVSKAGKVVLEDDTDVDMLKEFCDKKGFTLNAFFNSVTGFVLAKYNNSDSVTHTTIYNGRSDSRLLNSCTMAVRTIPVVTSMSDDDTVEGCIARLQKQLIDSMSHEECSFPELASEYKVRSDILVVFQGDTFEFNTFCGMPADIKAVDLPVAKAPISLSICIRNGKLEYEAEYNTALYSEAFIRCLLDSFSAASKEFTIKNRLRDITLLSEHARAAYVVLNDHAMEIRDVTIPALVDEQARKYPDRKAVVADGRSLTYKELSELSDAWANALVKNGITPDTIVGFVLERSVEAIITELAIMKAGGAFLPMIPTYPDDRIAYCLTNSESPAVITSAKIAEDRPALFAGDKPYKTITIESLYEEEIAPNTTKNEIDMATLSYCIYTSGSTGTPKGVMIEHRNMTNTVQTQFKHDDFLCDENDVGGFLALSSFSFDMSILEICLPLCKGKTLVIATEDEVHNPLDLKKLMLTNSVRSMIATPSYTTNLVSMEETKEVFRNLRTIIIGAEAFTPQLYSMLHEASPMLSINNGYGPTETAICCSFKHLTRPEGITIGRPTGNMKMFVVDRFMNILPPCATGELIICGRGVGRGYVKLPDRTSASFITMDGLPAYKSGDAVRMTPDSEIDFSGRIDNQVKLRGFRIELDEIENVILSCDSVLQSKVIVRNNGTEDYLAGFYTADSDISPDEVKEIIKSKLTYYMVPAVLVKLDKMPMTSNGKIDKKALPDTNSTTGSTASKHKSGKRAAKKSLEQRLCELFANVIGVEEVFADDNFFELGGTSLTASKVTMLLMSDGIDVKYGDIFDNPTPEELALFVETRNKKSVKEEPAAGSDVGNTRPALQYNLAKYAPEVKRESLGNVLLTGATGFLGIHVLKELLDLEEGHIYCLVRHGEFESSEIRLKTMLIYYFSEGFEKEFAERLTVIDGDITDSSLSDLIAPYPIDTIINCAACVKHFTDDDILERINVKGVEKLIGISIARKLKLVQISTVSVPGIHTEDTYARSVKMHENELFVVDDMDNKYQQSKYHAELKIFDAIENDGLRAKVIRVGNLMGRQSDGEFQANMETNMFLRGIRGFYIMGKYPISHMTDPMSFSPIDCTARAVVLLAGTNDKFTAFNANNRYSFDEMKLIDACNANGVTILPEDDEKYYAEFRAKLADNRINAGLNGLAAYDIVGAHAVETDNLFTTNILYRIGFSWPLVDDAYLERAINSLETLGFFEWENDGE